jgi:hypothetical protein
VNVPGGGDLVLAKTQKVRAAGERAKVAGKVTLPIKPRGKAQKKLNEKGKAKVKAKVTYMPDGGGRTPRARRSNSSSGRPSKPPGCRSRRSLAGGARYRMGYQTERSGANSAELRAPQRT